MNFIIFAFLYYGSQQTFRLSATRLPHAIYKKQRCSSRFCGVCLYNTDKIYVEIMLQNYRKYNVDSLRPSHKFSEFPRPSTY